MYDDNDDIRTSIIGDPLKRITTTTKIVLHEKMSISSNFRYLRNSYYNFFVLQILIVTYDYDYDYKILYYT